MPFVAFLCTLYEHSCWFGFTNDSSLLLIWICTWFRWFCRGPGVRCYFLLLQAGLWACLFSHINMQVHFSHTRAWGQTEKKRVVLINLISLWSSHYFFVHFFFHLAILRRCAPVIFVGWWSIFHVLWHIQYLLSGFFFSASFIAPLSSSHTMLVESFEQCFRMPMSPMYVRQNAFFSFNF